MTLHFRVGSECGTTAAHALALLALFGAAYNLHSHSQVQYPLLPTLDAGA